MYWLVISIQYIINPRFDGNNLSGWEGEPFGAYEPMENAEHYNKTYNTYQRIEGLPAGKYRVSLQAFYRMGSANNDYSLYSSSNYADYQYAKLYANSSTEEVEVSIVSASSAALDESLGGGTSTVGGSEYIPNNMVAANYWFEAGYYINSIEVNVGDDGMLIIGIYKNQTINNDWTCLDN